MSDQIIADIERAYESLSDPRYFVISRRMNERPYDAFIEELEYRFQVVDTTDENDDVSFILSVSGSGGEWALGLSAVAPYAVLARANPSTQIWTQILTVSSPDLTQDEHWLINRVAGMGLRFLDRQELERPVPLNIVGLEPDRVRVYQALFTSSDILPWDLDTFKNLGLT